MKKILALIVSVLFVVSFAGFSFAVEKPATTQAEKKAETAKPGEAAKPGPAARVKQISGEVKAVDAQANTLTVKGKKAEVTVTCNDKTKIMMGKEKKTLADVKVGDKVIVKYTESEGKNIAKSVAIKQAGAEEKPAVEKKTEKSPAQKAK